MNISFDFDHNNSAARGVVAQAARDLFDAKVIDIVQYFNHIVKLANDSSKTWYSIGEIEAHLGVKSPDTAKRKEVLDMELIAIANSEGKIQAIKHCRFVTGLGLKEAKDYVDALCPAAHHIGR